MRPWAYRPSDAVAIPLSERLERFPLERDLSWWALRTAWQAALRIAMRAYLRLSIEGRDRLPPGRSFLLVANHSSHLDAMVLAAAVPARAMHRIHAAAALDYFYRSPWLRFATAVLFNAVPFDRRDRRRESLERCAALLRQPGRVLLLFPEGTRSEDGRLGPFRRGAGSLLAGTDVLAVPAWIEGARLAWPKGARFPRPRKVRVVLGEPRSFEGSPRTEEGFERVARELEAEVRRLGMEGA